MKRGILENMESKGKPLMQGEMILSSSLEKLRPWKFIS